MKYNPMFALRSQAEFKKIYKNPTVIVGVVALVLVILSCFLPYYTQPNGVSITIETLIAGIEEKATFVTIVAILNLCLAVASATFGILFKNTAKLSGLNMVLGGVILLSTIFQFFYCTKTGVAGNFEFTYGSICAIVAGLLIVCNEFYKLGWQGYEVKEEEEAVKQQVESANFEDNSNQL